jgi:hypothetical protein
MRALESKGALDAEPAEKTATDVALDSARLRLSQLKTNTGPITRKSNAPTRSFAIWKPCIRRRRRDGAERVVLALHRIEVRTGIDRPAPEELHAGAERAFHRSGDLRNQSQCDARPGK